MQLLAHYLLALVVYRSEDIHLDGIVSVIGSFKTLDTDCHLSLADHSSGSIVVDGIAHGSVELINVLSVDSLDLESLSFKSLGDAITLQVFGWVTTDYQL